MAKIKEQYIPFKVIYTFEQRKQKHKQTLQKLMQKNHPNPVILIILQPHPKSKLPILQNCRFCCQADRSLNYLKQQIINKKLKLNQNRSLFLYTGKTMLVGDQSLGKLRDMYADQDGFLYVTYAEMDVY